MANIKNALIKIKNEASTLKFKIILFVLGFTQVISFFSYNFWFNSTWATSKHIIKNGIDVLWLALKSWNFAIAWSALYSNVIFFFSCINFTKSFAVWLFLLLYLGYIFYSNLKDNSIKEKQEPLKKQADENVQMKHTPTVEDQLSLINECYNKEFYEDMANAEESNQEEVIEQPIVQSESKQERLKKYL